jgi:hypothetical protein
MFGLDDVAVQNGAVVSEEKEPLTPAEFDALSTEKKLSELYRFVYSLETRAKAMASPEAMMALMQKTMGGLF